MGKDKKLFFVSGLPRSGSTLLMNILAQNPGCYTTPSSGLLPVLRQIRNSWDSMPFFKAINQEESERKKLLVLRGVVSGYFADQEVPVIYDKNRGWPRYLEMASAVLGGDDKVKVILTVRDVRDVLASFEKLHRKTSALSRTHQEAADNSKWETALARIKTMGDEGQPVGGAFNTIRDAATRGWLPHMHFVEFEKLTMDPEATMAGVYDFLGLKHFNHNFDEVEQVTQEDDAVHGFKDLHRIRRKVEPMPPQWPIVFDDTVTKTEEWGKVESVAQFWKAYLPKDG